MLPDMALPVKKLVPIQLVALALDQLRLDEEPLIIEIGLADIVALGVGAGTGAGTGVTIAAAAATILASSVTAVCAKARPFNVAPVFMIIAV